MFKMMFSSSPHLATSPSTILSRTNPFLTPLGNSLFVRLRLLYLSEAYDIGSFDDFVMSIAVSTHVSISHGMRPLHSFEQSSTVSNDVDLRNN
jgi:hypothetical protein